MDSAGFRQLHAIFGMFCILFSYGFVTGLLYMTIGSKESDERQNSYYIWKYLFTYFPFAAPVSSITAFFISQLATGIISDKYGRRFVLSTSIIPLVISSVLLTFTKSWMSLVLIYFIAGLSSGGLNTTLVLVTETSSPKYRVASINLLPIFYVSGLVTSIYLGLFSVWKILYLYGVLSTACALLMSLTLPESHYWLAKKGKLSEFKYSFNWYRGNDLWEFEDILDNENVEMKAMNFNKTDFVETVPVKTPSIFNKELVMALSISFSCILFILSSSRLTFAVFAFSAIATLPAINLDDIQIELVFTFLAIYLLFSVISSYLKLRFIVIIAGVISLLIFLLSSYFLSYGFTPNHLSLKLSLVSVYLFLISFVINPSLMTILLVSLPTSNRGLGVSLINISLVVLVKIFMLMSLDLFKNISIELVMIINMFVLILSLCHIFYCAPEPYCRSLAEIENYFKGSKKRRNMFEYSQVVIDEKLLSCPFPVSAIINDV